MAKNNLFAPPTREEVQAVRSRVAQNNILAPPSSQEVQQIQQPGQVATQGPQEPGFFEKALSVPDRLTGAAGLRTGLVEALKPDGAGFVEGLKQGTFGPTQDIAPGAEVARQLGVEDKPRIMPELFQPAFQQRTGQLPEQLEPQFEGFEAPKTETTQAERIGTGIDIVADPALIIGGTIKLFTKGLKALSKGAKVAKGTKAPKVALSNSKSREVLEETQRALNLKGDIEFPDTKVIGPRGIKESKNIVTKDVLRGDRQAVHKWFLDNGFSEDELKQIPEILEFTDESIQARRAESIAGRSRTGADFRKNFNDFLDKTQEAVEELPEVIAGKELGDVSSHGKGIIDEVGDELFHVIESNDVRYSTLRGGLVRDGERILFPEGKTPLSPKAAEGIQKFVKANRPDAKRFMERLTASSQTRGGAETLNTFLDSMSQTKTLDELTTLIQELGSITYRPRAAQEFGDMLPNMKAAYRELNNAVMDTVRVNVSPEFAKDLITSNKALSKTLKNLEILDGAIKKGDNEFLKDVFRNPKKIQALMDTVDGTTWREIQGLYLKSLERVDVQTGLKAKPTLNAIKDAQKKGILKKIFPTIDDQEALLDYTDGLAIQARLESRRGKFAPRISEKRNIQTGSIPEKVLGTLTDVTGVVPRGQRALLEKSKKKAFGRASGAERPSRLLDLATGVTGSKLLKEDQRKQREGQ